MARTRSRSSSSSTAPQPARPRPGGSPAHGNQAASEDLDAGSTGPETPVLDAAAADVAGMDFSDMEPMSADAEPGMDFSEDASGFGFESDSAVYDQAITDLEGRKADAASLSTEALPLIRDQAKAALRAGDGIALLEASQLFDQFMMKAWQDFHDRHAIRTVLESQGFDLSEVDALNLVLDELWVSGFAYAFHMGWYPDHYEGPRGTERFQGRAAGTQPPSGTTFAERMRGWEAFVEDAVERWAAAFEQATRLGRWASTDTDKFYMQMGDLRVPNVNRPDPPGLEDAVGRERAYLLAVLRQHLPEDVAGLYDGDERQLDLEVRLQDQQDDFSPQKIDLLEVVVGACVRDAGRDELDADHVWSMMDGATTGPEKEYVLRRLSESSVPGRERSALWIVQQGLRENGYQAAYDCWRIDAGPFSGNLGAIAQSNDSFAAAVEATVIETLGGLDDLLRHLAEMSVDAALDLVGRFWDSHRGVIEEYLQSALNHPLYGDILGYVLGLVADAATWLFHFISNLTVDQVIDFITTGAKVIAAVVGMSVLAGALFLLDHAKQHPIIGGLAEDIVLALWEAAPDAFKQFVRDIYMEIWPEGYGISLEVLAGATFGVPIHVGREAYMRVSHSSPGVFELVRGGINKVGVDVGVGVGFQAGRPTGAGTRANLGAHAGAQAGAGVKTLVHETYRFELVEDRAFLSLIMGVMNGLDAGADTMIDALTGQSGVLDPSAYLSSVKMEVKAYAEGGAQANASLTPGMDDGSGATSSSQRFGHGQDEMLSDQSRGGPGFFQRLLRIQASVGAQLSAEVGGGMQISNLQRTEGEVTAADVDIYGEAAGVVAIGGSLPVPIPLPQAALDLGVGVKASYSVQGAPGTDEAQWSEPQIFVYLKSGDMDRYVGNASETVMSLADFNQLDWDTLDAFVESMGDVTFTKRIAVQHVSRRLRGELNRLPVLRRQGDTTGLQVTGAIDFQSKLSRADLQDLVGTLKGMASRRGGLDALKDEVVALFTTGTLPDGLLNDANEVAGALSDACTGLDAHLEVGVAGQMSASAAAGLKVRADVGGSATITYDVDLLRGAESAVELVVDDVKELLTGPSFA